MSEKNNFILMQRYSQPLLDVGKEIEFQHEKWGAQNHHPQMWLNILMEEVGETSKAMMEAHFRGASWEEYRKEMIQVAAVALSAIENFDRMGAPHGEHTK